MKRVIILTVSVLIGTALLLTACKGKKEAYPEAIIVLGYQMSSNGGACGDYWYVLPEGYSVHEQDLEGDVFSETAHYIVNKDSMTIQLFEHEQFEGVMQSHAGYLLRVDLEKQTLTYRYVDCNGNIDEGIKDETYDNDEDEEIWIDGDDEEKVDYSNVPGITGPSIKHVDWEGLKALFAQ